VGGQHHTGPWSNEDKKLVNLCPGGRTALRRPKPPIKGGYAPEEEKCPVTVCNDKRDELLSFATRGIQVKDFFNLLYTFLSLQVKWIS